MTSQVLLLNKNNIILGSDKAQSMPNDKTYDGVNKIFPISQNHSAALMYNGNAEFEGMPIELLINGFCKNNNIENFKSISEIKNRLVKYISKNTPKGNSNNFIEDAVKEFKFEIEEEIYQKGFKKAVKQKTKKGIPSFIKKYSNFDDEFCDIIPNGYDKKRYNKLLWKIFSHNLHYYGTGIILAGYDNSNDYPTIFEFNIYCKDDEKIIIDEVYHKINCSDPQIRVYAINEEAYTFITGVNDEFIEFILNYIESRNDGLIFSIRKALEKKKIENNDSIMEIVEDSLKEEYSDIYSEIEYYRNMCINYTSDSIKDLPEWLLCIFAEHLIKLTAIKQKTTSEIESVSISTDIYVLKKYAGYKICRKKNRIF